MSDETSEEDAPRCGIMKKVQNTEAWLPCGSLLREDGRCEICDHVEIAKERDISRSRVMGISCHRDFLSQMFNPRGRVITSDMPEDLRIVGMKETHVDRGWILWCWSESFAPVPRGQEAPMLHEPFTYTDHGSIDIVFEGGGGPVGPRFVEVENMQGKSISVGEWIERGEGICALRLPAAVSEGGPPEFYSRYCCLHCGMPMNQVTTAKWGAHEQHCDCSPFSWVRVAVPADEIRAFDRAMNEEARTIGRKLLRIEP